MFRQLLEILVDSDKINEPLSVTALYILLGTFVSHESKLESDCGLPAQKLCCDCCETIT